MMDVVQGMLHYIKQVENTNKLRLYYVFIFGVVYILLVVVLFIFHWPEVTLHPNINITYINFHKELVVLYRF